MTESINYVHCNLGYSQETRNHSWPDKLGITKLGTEQDKGFSYTCTAAIQYSNKSGHVRVLESLPFKCDAHAILPVQSNCVRFVTTVTKWFQLRHLRNVRKIAKSQWCNTLEWRLLRVCIQYHPWSAYTVLIKNTLPLKRVLHAVGPRTSASTRASTRKWVLNVRYAYIQRLRV